MAKKQKKVSFYESIKSRINFNFSGAVVGLIFFCLSFTPSLLPRGFVLQGVAAGISFATGYGIGILISFILHKLPPKWKISFSPQVKKIIIGLLLVFALIFIFAGFNWQQEIRKITQADPVEARYPFLIILIAAILGYLLILAGRGIRRLSKYFTRKVNRWLGPKLSMYLGALIAAIVLIFFINGVLFKTLFGFINYSFGLANKGTPAGIYQPQSSIHSGSRESAIDWNSLGEKGREFVATAPAKSDIEKFAGKDLATQPSRLYVGLESAPTLQERVKLIVTELDRTKADKRDAILIAIPTGSGGVNAKSIQSVEYLFNGNTTSLGIQYSYLPSWLSFLADQETARENGKVLVENIYNWWNHLSPENRPKLLMYGESLGTLGADGAFSGPSDMQNRMNGVLLAGPPHANQLWQGIVADRQLGTREVLPVYQNGEIVRFSDGKVLLTQNPKPNSWGNNRVGIMQHASDPVVWGAFSLFLNKPDWLREERGYDVLPNMRWYPFVTAWQVALDLPFAFGATSGHGHRYGDSLTTAWSQVLNIQLSNEKTKQLQTIIDQVKG